MRLEFFVMNTDLLIPEEKSLSEMLRFYSEEKLLAEFKKRLQEERMLMLERARGQRHDP
jgi:hypothetical protein